MYYSYMLGLNIQVPVPKKISGYQQIILPFQTEIWLSLGLFYHFQILNNLFQCKSYSQDPALY